MSVFFAAALAFGVLVVAWGTLTGGAGQGTVARSAGPSPIATSGTSTAASASPDASGGPPPGRVALAVVSGFDNYAVTSITRAELASRLASGTLIVPCGAESAVAQALGSTGTGATTCVAADQITGALAPASTELALLLPALVTPRVKVVPLEDADLFGEKPARARAYPLTIARPATWPAAWSAWTASD
jgi:hypothetical protein